MKASPKRVVEGGKFSDWRDPLADLHQPSRGKQRKRKDTKRWCRGKVGVEHKPEVVIPVNASRGHVCEEGPSWIVQLGISADRWRCAHVLACADCDKVLDHWLPRELCPVWQGLNAG